MDVTITDAQLKALRRLDPVLTAKQVVQTHVDTWLAPYVADLSVSDRRTVAQAYEVADADTQQQVKTVLGI